MKNLWVVTKFDKPELEAFSCETLLAETRLGVQILCLIFALLLASGALLSNHLGIDRDFFYTSIIITFLCMHVAVTARFTKEIKTLYLLGVALLVISSTAFVLLSHRMDSFDTFLFAAIVLIFSVVPIIPWALREATIVVCLNYSVFTFSTLVVHDNFEKSTLLMLQFFMLSTATISLSLVARNTSIRKMEIENRFELEETQKELYKQSRCDPLTGAWNRRYMKERFLVQAQEFHKLHNSFCFILFDLNDFKQINDNLGHDFGDSILQWLTDSFNHCMAQSDILIRMGGDEFALLTGAPPAELIKSSMIRLAELVKMDGRTDPNQVTCSFGMVIVPSTLKFSLMNVYKKADLSLYKAKEICGNSLVEGKLNTDELQQVEI